MSASSWWNDSFAIRRQLRIPIPTGLPSEVGDSLFAIFDYATMINSHKIRNDLSDIQTMYFDSQNNVWLEVPFEASLVDTNLIVEFNILFPVTTVVDDNYYIYMANPQLKNLPDFDNDFNSNEFSKNTFTNGFGLSFTRPTDEWVRDTTLKTWTSQVVGAKAAFTYSGTNAAFVPVSGPDKGMLQLTIDDQPPIMIDTYNSIRIQSPAYLTSGLTVGNHYIRVTTTGEKNPTSTDSKIEILGFVYSSFAQAIDLGEEIDPIFTPIRIIVGP